MTTATSLPTLQRALVSQRRGFLYRSSSCPPNPLGSDNLVAVAATGLRRGCLYQAASAQEDWIVLYLTRSPLCLILCLLFVPTSIRIFYLMHPPQGFRVLCLVDLVSFLPPAPAACIPNSVLHSSELAVVCYFVLYGSQAPSFASISYLVIRTAL